MMKHLKFYFLFLLGFISAYNLAQSSMTFKNGVEKQKIPFEYHHNLIIFPLEVNGAKLNFILDTGASKTVIFTLTEEDSLVLNNTKVFELRGLGYGEPIKALLSENNTIKVKDIHGANQTIYMVFSNQFDFSSKIGKTIHGIIGYELLKNFVVTIDYNKHILIFEKPQNFQPPKNEKKFSSHQLTFHQYKPYINGELVLTPDKKAAAKMLIDTGNSDALWLFENNEKGVEPSNLYFLDHLGEGLSGSIVGKRSKIAAFHFDRYTLANPTAAFLDTTATTYARTFEDRNGSIGNQIMSRFKVILHYKDRKMYLKKNNSFPKEFKYNRAGIELAYSGKTLVKSEKVVSDKYNSDRNAIQFVFDYEYNFKPIYSVYKIRPNSPADLIGLQVNDILYKVNGKPAYEYKIEDLINIFYGEEGKRIQVIVERNGVLFYYELVLKDLL